MLFSANWPTANSPNKISAISTDVTRQTSKKMVFESAVFGGGAGKDTLAVIN